MNFDNEVVSEIFSKMGASMVSATGSVHVRPRFGADPPPADELDFSADFMTSVLEEFLHRTGGNREVEGGRNSHMD